MSAPCMSPTRARPSAKAFGMNDHDRARTWQTSNAPTDSPLFMAKEETAPPTIAEIEAMEKAVTAAAAADEVCHVHVPGVSNVSSRKLAYSRQVSRVSGTGRTVRIFTPIAADAPPAAAAAAVTESSASESHRRGRSLPEPQQQERQPSVSRSQRDFHRRSISVDDPDRRPTQRFPRGQHPMATKNGASAGRRPVNVNKSGGTQQQPGQRVQPGKKPKPRPIPNGAKGGRVPYTALGTPSIGAANNNRVKQQQQPQRQRTHEASAASTSRGSRDLDISPPPPSMAAPRLRRRNSAPDMGVVGGYDMDEPIHDDGEPSPRHMEGGSPPITCWGGGLPPTCGPAAAAAAVAAATATNGGGSTAGNRRYPANDRESFARTLNEEELDEVWKCLGEGVSQRGLGSEVAFEANDNAPASPSGTGVSGAFPVLTTNVLERHDKMAEGSGSGSGRDSAKVVPMPRKLAGIHNRSMEDMENGASSKKRDRFVSEQHEGPTLLGGIISYGILVLWAAHLVFNILLLWDVVVNDYMWALCFVPGVLGSLLSYSSCRKSHRNCKSVNADEAEAQPRGGPSPPHLCALPAYSLLLVSTVACLGMHASAMLFCQKDMLLIFEEKTLEPLCGNTSLTLPVVLDAVLLGVAGLKASSVCWAWVLN